MIRTNQLGLLACLAALFLTGASHASTILTQSDPNGLAFHGRVTTANSGVLQILNFPGTNIGGVDYYSPNDGYFGSTMWISGQLVGTGGEVDTDLSDGLESYAEYTVNFSSEGTYRVYWSGQRTGDPQPPAEGSTTGGNNSLWIGGTDQDHTATSGWTSHGVASGSIFYRDTGVLWTIDNTNVNQDLTFTLGLREDGPVYDRIAFVLEGSGAGPDDLAVIVPEPSCCILVFAAAAGLLVSRRRFR